MKYEDIQTPEELLEFMASNLKYGVIDDEGKVYSIKDPASFQYGCAEKWKLKSPKELLNKKYGLCLDQVELERKWFTDHGYEIKTILISMNLDEDSTHAYHTYLLFLEDGKWNLFEHADTYNAGIYTFNFLNEAILFQMQKHIETNARYADLSEDNIKSIRFFDYQKPKFHINLQEYAEFIFKSLDITDTILTM